MWQVPHFHRIIRAMPDLLWSWGRDEEPAMTAQDPGVQVGGLGAQPGPKQGQAGAPVQQPHFIRMYPNSFTAEQCAEVIRRFEADERKHASTTATRAQPRLRSGTMLQIGDLSEWQDIAQLWSQVLENN